MKSYLNQMETEERMLKNTLMKEGSAYKEKLKLLLKQETCLLATMTQEQKQMYDDYYTTFSEANEIYASEHFKRGFQLGLGPENKSGQ